MAISSTKMRIGGLASGIDTDQVVSDLMKVERMPLDKIYKQKTKIEWKRDTYREMTSLLSGFKTEFLDVLSSTNMRSEKMYKVFQTTAANSNTGANSSVVSVTTTIEAAAGSHTISVSNLATSEKVQSSAALTKGVTSSKALNWTDAAEKDFYIELDGTKKKITIENGTDSISELQTLIDNTVGSNKVTISESSPGFLKFNVVGGSGVNKIVLSEGSSDGLEELGFGTYANFSNRINKYESLENISYKLNNGFSFDSDDEINLDINGEEFTFSKTDTLVSMMNEINSNSGAGVYMRYDEINDKIYFEAKQTGEGSNISISETGSTFLTGISFNAYTGDDASGALKNYSALGSKSFSVVVDGTRKDIVLDGDYSSGINSLKTALETKIEAEFSGLDITVGEDESGTGLTFSIVAGASTIAFGEPMSDSASSALTELGMTANYTGGEDAVATVDGNTIVRSSNSFTVDGVTYKLLKENITGEHENISLSLDVDTVYDNIKKFIDKYNEVIGKINDKISEEVHSDYEPLTDEEKQVMSEETIKLWEEKAKSGLLRNDTTLESALSNFRRAFYDSVSGVSKTLSAIGITTGNYAQKGKLTIDETKLKNAITNDPDGVMSLFSQQSVSYPSNPRTLSSANRTTRYDEEGLAYRIYDIIEDNISVVKDSNDYKGFLLQKAGLVGDSSEYDNYSYTQIKDYNAKIKSLTRTLQDKEDRYYQKFASMEKIMSQMNSQADWLSSQLASMSG